MKNAKTTNQQVESSEWAPLRIAAFRAIWFASPFGQHRDVVPEHGRRLAHDAFHHLARPDRADADGHHAARVPGGTARRDAGRYREPPPPAARHRGADERAPAARLHLRNRFGGRTGEPSLAGGQHRTGPARRAARGRDPEQRLLQPGTRGWPGPGRPARCGGRTGGRPPPHRAVLPAERLVGALRVAKRAWVWRAITSARVVLPLPGGP